MNAHIRTWLAAHPRVQRTAHSASMVVTIGVSIAASLVAGPLIGWFVAVVIFTVAGQGRILTYATFESAWWSGIIAGGIAGILIASVVWWRERHQPRPAPPRVASGAPYAGELSGLDILGRFGPAAHTAWVNAGCPPITDTFTVAATSAAASVDGHRRVA